ncbi:unnamed protein product [Paramecium pentaurelia]|uniref:ABC transporter family protein n=1 Tax=Paramecium pentaurelia TaxID=43138 RepID=A0A8S1VWN5_9CILI|nr:unnamed protein product [Paramecium pentaurelia]
MIKERTDIQTIESSKEIHIRQTTTTNLLPTIVIDHHEEQHDQLQPSLQVIEESVDVSQQKEDHKFYPKYLGQRNYWISKLFFYHYTQYSLQLKNHVLDKNLKITQQHLPLLSPKDDLQKSVDASLKKINQFKQVTTCQLVKIIFFGELKWVTFKCIIAFFIESLSKNGISFILSNIITCVSQNDIKMAHFFAIIMVSLNLLCTLSRHHAANQSIIFSSKARLTLINLVYIKLIELNQYSFKQANIGKILNILSGDINTLEQVLSMIFPSSVVIISLLLASYILWDRFNGFIGILVVAIIFIAYPIQIFLQSFNSQTLKLQKQHQDKRFKITNELIEGIRLIKMYAWEQAFKQMILTARREEFICLLKVVIRSGIDRLFTLISQIWASLLFFIILYYGGYRNEMKVAEMISTLQLLSFLKLNCVYMVSYGIQSFIQIKVSFERIAKTLNLQNFEMKQLEQEVQNQQKNECQTDDCIIPIVSFKNFQAFWTHSLKKDDKPVLKNINLDIYEGETWAVIGQVGSGKSSFLHSLLSEIPSYKGTLLFNGQIPQESDLTIAYVEQEPYIFPDTIRQNILFGRPYNRSLYQKVTQATELDVDFSLMKSSDHTEIGERGITLSGGQKARISLARALYSLADIYLFDDPLSAVDAHVAEIIFQLAIKQFIFSEQPLLNPKKQRPIVFIATHQIQYAVKCDKIAILNEGEIIAQGTYDQIKQSLYMINKGLALQLTSQKNENKNQDEIRSSARRRTGARSTYLRNLTIQEQNLQQVVDLTTFVRYFKYWKCFELIIILGLEAGSEIIIIFYQRIISLFQEYQTKDEINYAYTQMGILTIALLFCNFIKYIMNILQVQKTTQHIHKQMLESISIAPISYFDTNPSGRIINRFSNDLSLCDAQTNQVCLDILELIGNFLFALVTLAILQPFFLIMIIALLLIDIYIYSFYNKIISQLKENELIQRSPLFDFIKKTLGGAVQVRVYGQREWFIKQFYDLSNQCNLNSLTYYYQARCFGFNIDMIGFFAQTVGLFFFLNLNNDDIAIFSQGVLLLATYNDGLQLGLRQMINFATQMNSYNRMFEIIDIPPEAPHIKQEDKKFNKFPLNGDIVFENVYMRYRANSDLILKGISFKIQSGQKIGCVGRTGAGKSSILYAIFRMSEIEDDEDSFISISGVEIKNLGLRKLRSSIGIIPQCPFLFTGTVKSNLDPFEENNDESILKALEITGLIEHIKQFPKGILTDISDVNSVFSVGQKQLICLTRILLSKKKIVVLDEATANLDLKTDDFIQETLKKQLKDCTLITIAHRLNTIADYDKVMVIYDGRVIEYDKPFNLLAKSPNSTFIDRNSEFSRLVKNTGNSNAQAIFDIAKKQLSIIEH